MKPEIKKMWIDALRSGEYKQAFTMLMKFKTDEDLINNHYVPNETELKDASYCCLGVLCDLYRKTTGENLWKKGFADFQFDNRSGTLPSKVRIWAELPTSNPLVKVNENEMSKLKPDLNKVGIAAINDVLGYNFNQIADIIEEQL